MLKLMVFLKPYKKWTVFMFLLLFIQVLGTLYIPTLTAGIVNSGIVAGDLNYVRETGVLCWLSPYSLQACPLEAPTFPPILQPGWEVIYANAYFSKSSHFPQMILTGLVQLP